MTTSHVTRLMATIAVDSTYRDWELKVCSINAYKFLSNYG